MNSVIVQSSEDLKKEIAALEFEILRIEQYLLSLYMASFDEQVTSFSPHTETSLVSQSDLTGVCSATIIKHLLCLNVPLHVLGENTRYVYGHHTTLKDLLGSSHIVDDMENPSRLHLHPKPDLIAGTHALGIAKKQTLHVVL
ncbi:hypothetical protein Bca4012_091777 [Brassica carinata]